MILNNKIVEKKSSFYRTGYDIYLIFVRMDTTMSQIRQKRKSKKITQDEIAKHLGVSRELVGLYENGKSFPRLDVLNSWCAYLGIEITIKEI